MSKFMKKIQSKIEKVLDANDGGSSTEPGAIPPLSQPPTARQIYRYRKQRGVNLGSWFTLENWLTPSLFQGAAEPKSSEIDVLRGLGPQDARSLLENHWAHFIDAGDWNWLVQHGINTVRIPVSYYHFLPGHTDEQVRKLMSGTEYESFAEVYVNAWKYVISAIQTADAHNIGVLVDLHGAPGAQNADAHSGLSGGRARLWDSKEFQKRTVEILVAMAREVVKYDNVVGLELLNEPKNNDRLMNWYDEATGAIRKALGPQVQELPMYVSDAWDTNWYSKYVSDHSSPGSFIVLDHHLYRCFTPQDQGKSASQHAGEIHPSSFPNGPSALMLANAAKKTHGSIVIGEWSAALNPVSLSSYPDDPSKLAAQREWGHAQWEAYERWCGGWFFWTLKKEGGSDRGWSYYTAVEQGVLPSQADSFKNALISGRHSAESLRDRGKMEMEGAMRDHVGYWNDHSSNPNEFEHWRFEEGFNQGWKDCIAFCFGSTAEKLNGSEIGFVGQWKRMRTAAHQRDRGNSKLIWEFEHGFEQAVSKFCHL